MNQAIQETTTTTQSSWMPIRAKSGVMKRLISFMVSLYHGRGTADKGIVEPGFTELLQCR